MEVQPNKHGVYPEELAERIVFEVSGKASCEILLLEIPGEWLVSVDSSFRMGDYHGSSGPLTRNRTPLTSRLDALLDGLEDGMKHFHTGHRGGCATTKQVQVSIEMNTKLMNYRANLIGDVSSLPVGTQLGMFQEMTA